MSPSLSSPKLAQRGLFEVEPRLIGVTPVAPDSSPSAWHEMLQIHFMPFLFRFSEKLWFLFCFCFFFTEK